MYKSQLHIIAHLFAMNIDMFSHGSRRVCSEAPGALHKISSLNVPTCICYKTHILFVRWPTLLERNPNTKSKSLTKCFPL